MDIGYLGRQVLFVGLLATITPNIQYAQSKLEIGVREVAIPNNAQSKQQSPRSSVQRDRESL